MDEPAVVWWAHQILKKAQKTHKIDATQAQKKGVQIWYTATAHGRRSARTRQAEQERLMVSSNNEGNEIC